METLDDIKKPTKDEQKLAIKSYAHLFSILRTLDDKDVEIEIDESKERIKLPYKSLIFLKDILKLMSEGKQISIVPIATEVTTQKAAEILGCSRPYLVKLLEKGKINFTKVGKHRRILYEDVLKFKEEMKNEQKNLLTDIINFDEEIGLYDS